MCLDWAQKGDDNTSDILGARSTGLHEGKVLNYPVAPILPI